MQLPLYTPVSKIAVVRPVSSLPSWRGAKRIGIDLETNDPLLKQLGPGVRRGGKVAGIAVAIEDGEDFYLPIGHSEDNLDPELVWRYLREQAAEFDGIIVGANLQYDLDYLWENGVVFPKVKWYRDIQVAEPLLDDLQDSYSLENIAIRRSLPGKDESVLRDAASDYGIDPKKEMWKLPGRYVVQYAVQDVRLPLQILRRQEREIEDQNLQQIFDLESRLLPVLVKMRRRGVRVDLQKLEKVEAWTIFEQQKALDEIERQCGVRLGLDDMNKSSAKAKVLKKIGVECPQTKPDKKGNTRDSVTKELLDSIKHPVAALLRRATKVEKIRSTFCASVREHMVRGRIHATFNQLRMNKDEDGDGEGARYGRMSCVDPNLQQQPGRDPEIGPLWRSIYVPDEDMLWAAMDYSQQEPRFVVHYAELCKLPVADQMGHRFRTDPKTDNHTEMARIICAGGDDWVPDKKVRGEAKEIFLGLCYGMGGARLCRKLKKPTEWIFSKKRQKMVEVAGAEGQAILDNFDRKVPYVRKLAKLCEEQAEKAGCIITFLGRRCRFPLLTPEEQAKRGKKHDWTHKALNRLIQGSSGDQTKLAVVELDAAGMTPQLQIHDEIDDSVPTPEDAEKRADVMRHCIELKVPSKVDVEIGDSWGGSMK